jgi:hypothetical protein
MPTNQQHEKKTPMEKVRLSEMVEGQNQRPKILLIIFLFGTLRIYSFKTIKFYLQVMENMWHKIHTKAHFLLHDKALSNKQLSVKTF